MTKEEAIRKAKLLVATFPSNKDAESLVNLALKSGIVDSYSDAMAVWGRVRRELRANANN